ncbi:MAG: flagellin [Desulfobacteraceae bacterium]|nr:MAG: flagellin [Desulfobacteraceae bacterium]
MGLRIQNNIAAINAHRQLSIADAGLGKSLQRLSSGYRINSAADDAAGLAVSSGMRADIASYKVASRNTSEAIALLQVAEGAYDQISNILTRLKELTTQGTSANASGNSTDIQNEVTALKNELDRIANATEYNGTAVLRGYGTAVQAYGDTIDTAAERTTVGLSSISTSGVTDNVTYTVTAATTGRLTIANGTTGESETSAVIANGAQTVNFESIGITLSLGANYVATAIALNAATLVFTAAGGNFITGIKNDSNHYINVGIDKVSASDLTLTAVTGTALGDLDLINTAIDTLATSRGEIGATMNRLSYAAANLATTVENVQAAESVIRDVDMAAEMTSFTKNQILLQAGTAMLAQANMAPQNLLSLFGG